MHLRGGFRVNSRRDGKKWATEGSGHVRIGGLKIEVRREKKAAVACAGEKRLACRHGAVASRKKQIAVERNLYRRARLGKGKEAEH